MVCRVNSDSSDATGREWSLSPNIPRKDMSGIGSAVEEVSYNPRSHEGQVFHLMS